MSEELKLKLVFDSSDAERAADTLPDAMDRAARKSRRAWEGQGSKDTKLGGADYGRMAGMDPAIRKAMAEQAEAARKAAEAAAAEEEKRRNEEYKRQLRWNSRLQQDKDRAAADDEQSKLDDYRRRLQWNSRILEQEEKKKLEEYKRQLRWNSRQLEDKNRALAAADDWEKSFTNKIIGGLSTTKVALGAAFSFLMMGYQTFKQAFIRGSAYSTSTSAYGTQATDAFNAYIVMKNLSKLEESQVRSSADKVASMAQDIATGVTGEGAAAFQYFGMDRAALQKANAEGFKFTELLANMSDMYKKSGETPQFQQFARELLGDDWKQYRTAFAAGREVIQSSPITTEAGPVRGPLAPGIMQVNAQRLLQGLPPISDLRGGSAAGAGMPAMPFATSLQAMGGGDILSAINRGPMDNLVSAAEETASNTRILAGEKGTRMRMDPNGRISVVKE